MPRSIPSFQLNLSDALYRHPLAIWTELEVDLEDGQRLSQRQPKTVAEAAKNFLHRPVAKRPAAEPISKLSSYLQSPGKRVRLPAIVLSWHSSVTGSYRVLATCMPRTLARIAVRRRTAVPFPYPSVGSEDLANGLREILAHAMGMHLVHGGPELTHRLISGAQPARAAGLRKRQR